MCLWDFCGNICGNIEMAKTYILVLVAICEYKLWVVWDQGVFRSFYFQVMPSNYMKTAWTFDIFTCIL